MGFFEENRRRKNAERYERAERLERLKDQFGKVKDSYRNLSDEEKVALPGVVSELSPQRVMTVGSVIVTYRLNAADPLSAIFSLFSAGSAETKIREILTANPNADLVPMESALGVKIINIQRPGGGGGSIYASR